MNRAAEPVAPRLYSPTMPDAAEQIAVDSDEALMLAFAGGDMAAFDQLYARHRRGLYAFVARLAHGTSAPVDDVFQEVWLAIARARTQYRASARFRSWLYQIAHNRLVDELRVRRALLASEIAPADDDSDPLDALPDTATPAPDVVLERAQQAQRIARALDELPPAQREVFLLREHGELSLEEIARLTGVNAQTAKSRLRYAVSKLRAALRGLSALE